ncbi:tRNA (adenosine(37)-N6)-dimethylallyltransferase MiaA [Fulvivirga lutimaris]|uniref:tRNA (adenosine(37)-N6)-dimethylallyltransferase MiaA n=1 Tax=Fulvivirga lutimaris TaxID=1819566 RepID=UPI00162394FF|nr:tRNA (adenosine(37)-N6)-dimethylallyltransferase MiaA [Fulvivirga lutimaris]
MSLKPKYLVSIVGPTAVGKTALCIDLAKALRTEIISADSRQFYKEMSIGTAKPTELELSQVRHHFVDDRSIEVEFSAGKFEKEAMNTISELHKIKETVIMTGGSGLYIDAVLNGFNEMPEIDPEVRQDLNAKFENEGLEALLEELEKVDPKYYETVDKGNPHRVIRGLEVYLSSGEPYSSYRTGRKPNRDFNAIKIGLERPREELYARINQRVDIMMSQGLLDEVTELQDFRDKQALQTVGYKEIFDHLDGVTDLNEAVELIKRNSRRYAKRQMTWFRRDNEIKWFHPDDFQNILEYIKDQMKK